MILQSRERPFSVRQRQPDRCSRAFGRVAAARADFVGSDGAIAPGQLHPDAPLHPIPAIASLTHTTPRFETVSCPLETIWYPSTLTLVG
jgi:hypothetical protein